MSTIAIPADVLMSAAHHAVIDELRLNYSGRGMYGAECVGIVGSIGDAIGFALALFLQDDSDGLVNVLRGARIDDMGLTTIVYWPSLTVA